MASANRTAALNRAHDALIECQVQLSKYLRTTGPRDEQDPPLEQLAHGLDVARYVLSSEDASLRLP